MARAKTKNPPAPTHALLVFEALRVADDILSLQQVCEAAKLTVKDASRALGHLRNYDAVESVIGGDGRLWWFATPDTDKRMRVQEKRRPEDKGTRRPARRRVTSQA